MLFLVIQGFLPVTLFMCFMAAFVTGILWLRAKREAARRIEMEALARTMQMPFYEKDSFGLATQLQHFDLFRRERRRFFRRSRVRNVLRGRVGDTDVYLFDYTYIVSTGKSSKRVTQTVFFADNKKWYLPDFHLKPERWWDKLAQAVGMQSDIEFPENPAFSERFRIKGPVEDLIRQKFGPELQTFLLEQPPANLEGSNYYLIAYKRGKTLKPEAAKAFFDNCCRLTEIMQHEGNLELLSLAELKAALPADPVKAERREEG